LNPWLFDRFQRFLCFYALRRRLGGSTSA
jgi:hypothetical protein